MTDTSENQPVSFVKSFQVPGPPAEPAFLIPISEWGYVRSRVLRLRSEGLFFQTCGSIAAGVAGSALVGAVTLPKAVRVADAPAPLVAWGILILSGLVSVLAFIFAAKQRETLKLTAEDVAQEMDRIRTRYSPLLPASDSSGETAIAPGDDRGSTGLARVDRRASE